MKKFDITYEIVRRFMSDLLKAKNLPIFDKLFLQLQSDTSRYEAKLVLIMKSIPLMNKLLAIKFIKIVDKVIQNPANNSYLRSNINPLRTGLILYRVLDTVEKEFNISENTTRIIKDTISEQIRSSLQIYNDPDELMALVEMTDFEGNDCFWYLDEYDLYNILDCQIMDRVIEKKWSGQFDINSSILDYSTSHNVFEDKHNLFKTDRVFSEIRHEMLTFNKQEKTHQFKFEVWLHSMWLRFTIEAAFTLTLTIGF